MADINQFTLSGVVKGLPATAQSQSGGSYTVLQVAFSRFDGKSRQETWEELRVAVTQPEAAAEAARLRDGQRVALSGRLSVRRRKSQDGRDFQSLELYVSSVMPGAMYMPPAFTAGAPGQPGPAPSSYQSPQNPPPQPRQQRGRWP
ncbi:MAG: single-stranded DNA-binding protein [Victivallales bacterium]|nr:single-stranded DNA-binding protein [Victivallales bacterium]